MGLGLARFLNGVGQQKAAYYGTKNALQQQTLGNQVQQQQIDRQARLDQQQTDNIDWQRRAARMQQIEETLNNPVVMASMPEADKISLVSEHNDHAAKLKMSPMSQAPNVVDPAVAEDYLNTVAKAASLNLAPEQYKPVQDAFLRKWGPAGQKFIDGMTGKPVQQPGAQYIAADEPKPFVTSDGRTVMVPRADGGQSGSVPMGGATVSNAVYRPSAPVSSGAHLLDSNQTDITPVLFGPKGAAPKAITSKDVQAELRTLYSQLRENIKQGASLTDPDIVALRQDIYDLQALDPSSGLVQGKRIDPKGNFAAVRSTTAQQDIMKADRDRKYEESVRKLDAQLKNSERRLNESAARRNETEGSITKKTGLLSNAQKLQNEIQKDTDELINGRVVINPVTGFKTREALSDTEKQLRRNAIDTNTNLLNQTLAGIGHGSKASTKGGNTADDPKVANAVLVLAGTKSITGANAAQRLRDSGATESEVTHYMNSYFWGHKGRPKPKG